jgi:hypothetical protein
VNVQRLAAELAQPDSSTFPDTSAMHLEIWIQAMVPFGLISHCWRSLPLQVVNSMTEPGFEPSV